MNGLAQAEKAFEDFTRSPDGKQLVALTGSLSLARAVFLAGYVEGFGSAKDVVVASIRAEQAHAIAVMKETAK